jgi:hypothetical protein
VIAEPSKHTLRAAPALATIAASFTLAACGSSSGASSTTSKRSAHVTTTAPTPKGGTASVTAGPVHGKLVAENHAPTVGKKWTFSVTVTNASGQPLNGTVDIEFLFAGQIVGRDTPPTHPVKDGRWRELLRFPPAAVGQPLTFQAVVHTSAGSITLDWPIKVKK